MPTQVSFTVKRLDILDIAEEDSNLYLDVPNVHPEQLVWFQKCVEDFKSAQKWAIQVISEAKPAPRLIIQEV